MLRTVPVPDSTKPEFTGVCRGDAPCYICGRDLKNPRYWVHPISGGGVLLHRDDEPQYESDGGDLGMQAVGSDCARKVPAGYLHRY